MMTLLRCGGFASMIAIVVVGIASISEARSVPAFLGQPQQPGDYSCFTNGFGQVTNTCTTTRQFCVVLPIETASHTVQVNVLAPDISHNLVCQAVAVNRDATLASATTGISPSTFGSSQMLTLGTLSVPAAGGLYVCCNMSPSSSLQSVNF